MTSGAVAGLLRAAAAGSPGARRGRYSARMPVELTPAGTRGVPVRQPPKWRLALVQPLFDLFMGRRMRLLKLTTVGARSGNAHRVSLFTFPAGPDAWYVVASSGGTSKHPAWYYNMARIRTGSGSSWTAASSASPPRRSPARSASGRGARSSPGGRATTTTRPAPTGSSRW